MALSLTGCQQVCPPNVTAPPVLMLAFSTDTLTSTGLGFRRAEVRSAYLVRYGTADLRQPLDTLRQPTSIKGTKSVLRVYYDAQHPPQFAVPDYGRQSGEATSFRLLVPAASRTYDITDVAIEQVPGNNRCDGYRISRREAHVNGQLRDGVNQVPELVK